MVIRSLIMAWLRWLIGHISLEIMLPATNIIIAILYRDTLTNPVWPISSSGIGCHEHYACAAYHLESRRLLWVSLLAWLAGLLLAVFSRYLVLLILCHYHGQQYSVIFGTGLAAGANLLLLWQYHRRLTVRWPGLRRLIPSCRMYRPAWSYRSASAPARFRMYCAGLRPVRPRKSAAGGKPAPAPESFAS